MVVFPLNVSVSPSLVTVVCDFGIGMVWPLCMMPEGPMIKSVPLSVIVVDEEAGIGIVEPRMTTADARVVRDSTVVGTGAIVSVLSPVVIVVKLVIIEPEGRVRMVVEPSGSVKVWMIELGGVDVVGCKVKVEPFVVNVVTPVTDTPMDKVKVTRPWPDAVRVSTMHVVVEVVTIFGTVADAVGHLLSVG